MFEVFVASLIIIFLMTYIKLQTCLLRQKQLSAQIHGLGQANALKNIFIKTQQHRGMMGAYLKGDDSFKSKINTVRKEIRLAFTDVLKTNQHNDQLSQLALPIKEDWDQIEAESFNFTAKQSFTRHSLLIKRILALLNNLAEMSQLQKNGCYDPEYIKIIWFLLPVVAESVGKARAVGSGIAASGQSFAVDKVNIQFLSHKISSSFKDVEHGLSTVLHKDAGLVEQCREVDNLLTGFVDTMQDQFVVADYPSVKSPVFFDEATNKLASVFDFYDKCEQIVDSQLKNSFEHTKNSLQIYYGMLFCSLILIAVAGTSMFS